MLGQKQEKHQRYFTSLHPNPVKIQLSASQSFPSLGPICPILQEMLPSPTVVEVFPSVAVLLRAVSPGKGIVCHVGERGAGPRGCSLQSTLGWHRLPPGLSGTCRHGAKIRITGLVCHLADLAAGVRMGP